MSRCGRPTHRLEIPASHGLRTLVALGLESEDLFTLAHLGHAGRASRSRVQDRGVVISDALVVVSVSPHGGLLQTVLELKVVPVDHHGSDIRFAGGLWLSDTQVGGTINRLVETELGDLVLHLCVLFHDVARDLLVFGHFAFIGFVGLLSVIQHRGNGLSQNFEFVSESVYLVETRGSRISHLLKQEISLPLKTVLKILILLDLKIQFLEVFLLGNPQLLEFLPHSILLQIDFYQLFVKPLHQINNLLVVVFTSLFEI